MGRRGCCESSDYDEEPIVEAVHPITSDTMLRFIMDTMNRLRYSGLFFSEVTRELRAMKCGVATSEALELWSLFGSQFGYDASDWGEIEKQHRRQSLDISQGRFCRRVPRRGVDDPSRRPVRHRERRDRCGVCCRRHASFCRSCTTPFRTT